MKNLLMVLIAGLFVSSTAMATNGYVKGALGFSFGGETTVDAGNSTEVSFDLDSGVFLLGAYGYHLSPMLAAEVELSYRSNGLDLPAGSISVDSSMLNIAFNGMFNVPVENLPITPYFGGGLTIGNYSLEAGNDDDSGMGVGLQFFGGAEFMLQENFSIGADLRYLITVIDPELDNDDIGFSHLGLLINGKYSF